MGLFTRIFSGNRNDLANQNSLNWLQSNQKEIFTPGDVYFLEDSIVWSRSDKETKILFHEISNVYVAFDEGCNKLFIEDIHTNQIKFYISNKSSLRDKFHHNLIKLARQKSNYVSL